MYYEEKLLGLPPMDIIDFMRYDKVAHHIEDVVIKDVRVKPCGENDRMIRVEIEFYIKDVLMIFENYRSIQPGVKNISLRKKEE